MASVYYGRKYLDVMEIADDKLGLVDARCPIKNVFLLLADQRTPVFLSTQQQERQFSCQHNNNSTNSPVYTTTRVPALLSTHVDHDESTLELALTFNNTKEILDDDAHNLR